MVLHTRGRVGRRQFFSKPHLMYFKWGFFGFKHFEELVVDILHIFHIESNVPLFLKYICMIFVELNKKHYFCTIINNNLIYEY